MLTTEQKILCAISHLGIFTGLFVVLPLIIFLLSKDKFVKDQAKEALVFQLFVFAGIIISVILMIVLIGFITIAIVGLVALILPILATIANANDKFYEYPLTTEIARKI